MAKDVIRSLVSHVNPKVVTVNGTKLKIDELMSAVYGVHNHKDEIEQITKEGKDLINKLEAVMNKIILESKNTSEEKIVDNMTRFRAKVSAALDKFNQETLLQLSQRLVNKISAIENRKDYKGSALARNENNLRNYKATYIAMYTDILNYHALRCPYNIYDTKAKQAFNGSVEYMIKELTEYNQKALIAEYLATATCPANKFVIYIEQVFNAKIKFEELCAKDSNARDYENAPHVKYNYNEEDDE